MGRGVWRCDAKPKGGGANLLLWPICPEKLTYSLLTRGFTIALNPEQMSKELSIKKVQYLQRTFPLKKDPIVNALCQCMLWVDCDAFVIGIARCERTLIRADHK